MVRNTLKNSGTNLQISHNANNLNSKQNYYSTSNIYKWIKIYPPSHRPTTSLEEINSKSAMSTIRWFSIFYVGTE